MSVLIPTVWWEVVYGSDGYAAPARFKTREEAEEFEQSIIDGGYNDIYSGATEVNIQDHFFYHKA